MKAQRDYLGQEVSLLQQSSSGGASKITSEKLSHRAEVLREAMANSDPNFRKSYLRLFVDTVTVSDSEVAITGPKPHWPRHALG